MTVLYEKAAQSTSYKSPMDWAVYVEFVQTELIQGSVHLVNTRVYEYYPHTSLFRDVLADLGCVEGISHSVAGGATDMARHPTLGYKISFARAREIADEILYTIEAKNEIEVFRGPESGWKAVERGVEIANALENRSTDIGDDLRRSIWWALEKKG